MCGMDRACSRAIREQPFDSSPDALSRRPIAALGIGLPSYRDCRALTVFFGKRYCAAHGDPRVPVGGADRLGASRRASRVLSRCRWYPAQRRIAWRQLAALRMHTWRFALRDSSGGDVSGSAPRSRRGKVGVHCFRYPRAGRTSRKKRVKVLYPPRDTGFFWSTAINDPDGNFIEFTQLCDDWFKMLEERRSANLDVVSRWKASKGGVSQ